MQRVGEAASGWIPPWFPDWDGPWSPFLPRKLILEERQQIPNDPWWNQPVPWAVRSDLGTLRYSGHQTRGFQDLRMIFERSSNQGCFNPSRTRRNLVIEILYITNCIYIYTYIYIYICGCRWCMAVHLTIFPTVYLFSIFLQRLNFRPGRVSGHSAQTDTGERSRPWRNDGIGLGELSQNGWTIQWISFWCQSRFMTFMNLWRKNKQEQT